MAAAIADISIQADQSLQAPLGISHPVVCASM